MFEEPSLETHYKVFDFEGALSCAHSRGLEICFAMTQYISWDIAHDLTVDTIQKQLINCHWNDKEKCKICLISIKDCIISYGKSGFEKNGFQSTCMYMYLKNCKSYYIKLEQLERLHSEIPPAAPWLPILVIHIRSQVKTTQSQSYKFKTRNCRSVIY